MKRTTGNFSWAMVLTIGYFALFMAAERPAHAYLDPGSGTMIIQMIVAALAGALLSLRLFWRSLKENVMAFFSRGESSRDESSE